MIDKLLDYSHILYLCKCIATCFIYKNYFTYSHTMLNVNSYMGCLHILYRYKIYQSLIT